MWRYRIDIIKALSVNGYSTSRIRHEHILSECTLQRIRHNQAISLDSIVTICSLLSCTIDDIIEIY